jgi:predicted DNA-binding protein with PD1-like motif
LNDHGGLRTFALVLGTGNEAMAAITSFARERQLRASQFTAIGAFSKVVVAYFDWETKEYRNSPIAQQVEVLSLVGDITLDDGKPKVHAHVVISKADATAHGGHFVEGLVRPTLEIVITETSAHLRRRFDPQSGLALIDPGVAAGRRGHRPSPSGHPGLE